MIKSVDITNYVGETVKVTLDQDKPTHGLMITNIDGLGPGAAAVAKQAYGIVNGSYVSSVRFEERNIVITFRPSNSSPLSIEEARLNCYKYCPPGTYVDLAIHTEIYGEYLHYFISGLIESIEPTIFSEKEEIKVSILCEEPFFKRVITYPKPEYETKRFNSGTGISPTINTEPEYFTAEYIMVPYSPISIQSEMANSVYLGIDVTNTQDGVTQKNFFGLDFGKLAALHPEKTTIDRGDKVEFYHNATTGAKRILYYRVKTISQDYEEVTWYDPWDVTSCEFTNSMYVDHINGTGTIIYPYTTQEYEATGTAVSVAYSSYVSGILWNGRGYVTYPTRVIKDDSDDSTSDIEYAPNEAYFLSSTLAILNSGNIESGALWEWTVSTGFDVTNQSILYFGDNHGNTIHVDLYKVMELYKNYVGDTQLAMRLLAGDVITMSTVDRQKYIKFKRGNNQLLVLDACGTVNFDWPRLYPGYNLFSITGIDKTYWSCKFTYDMLFGGM